MIDSKPGALPHIQWLDLNGNGVYTECCILKIDNLNNICYFPINSLDMIDKKRLSSILNGRLANQMACWQLLEQTTLNNGVNALEYFHQLVKVISPQGQVYSPKSGIIGTGQISGKMDTRSIEERILEEKEMAEDKIRKKIIKGE